ncbi:MAG: FAD-dependent oxidoreductase, partial [Planctomycetia bacterium]|nr:FAD-dependent oxidoreductase [Planctomycetia bacterium]
DGGGKVLRTTGEDIAASAVIIATGAASKKLGVPGEKEFFGKGVSVCATCDAPLFRDKIAVVVGGGETAVEEAAFLTRFVKKLYLVHRRDRLRASKIAQVRLFAAGEKVEMCWESVLTKINGATLVESVELRNVKTEESRTVACNGVFVFVGFTPNTGFLKEYLEMDDGGHIITDNEMATSVAGVFACGDVRQQRLKQAIIACGEGAIAAYSAQRYVETMRGTLYK